MNWIVSIRKHTPRGIIVQMSQSTESQARNAVRQTEAFLQHLIFASRWVQVPLFLGLIVASVLYAIRFMQDLVNLIPLILTSNSSEPLLLAVLGLVDMTLVANLIAMIVIGGYSLFVGKLSIVDDEDRPEWLDKTTAATLKIKLASALVGVSGIHLLKTFIEIGGEVDLSALSPDHHAAPHTLDNMKVMWQVIIHVVFLLSALLLSWGERILHPPEHH